MRVSDIYLNDEMIDNIRYFQREDEGACARILDEAIVTLATDIVSEEESPRRLALIGSLCHIKKYIEAFKGREKPQEE